MLYLSENISQKVAQIQASILNASHIVEFQAAVMGSVKGIGIALIVFIVIVAAKRALYSGGKEAIDPIKDIFKPLAYYVILLIWPSLLVLISNVGNTISHSFINNALSNEYANAMTAEIVLIRAKIFTKPGFVESFFGPVSTLFKLRSYLQTYALDVLLQMGLALDEFFILLFAAYTEIVKIILIVVSPIALVLSFFAPLKNTIFTWLKSFLSVFLWFGVAAFIFNMVNHIALEYYQSSMADNSVFDFAQGIWFGLIFIIFGLFKGILMFKVPQIISMFMGSSPSGGMFGAAFAPLMVAMGVAKTGASAGASAVSSGVSKFKK